jgi:hypothetical protein
MHKKGLALLGILAYLALTGFAQTQKPATPDVSGIWEFTMQTPGGEMKNDATFIQTKVEEKTVIKFSMPGPMDMEMKGEGTITGNELAWTVTLNTPNGDFQLLFKGKVDGDKMAGEVQAGDFGSSSWTAVKKKG